MYNNQNNRTSEQ